LIDHFQGLAFLQHFRNAYQLPAKTNVAATLVMRQLTRLGMLCRYERYV
jgi:hypothetical protein